MRYAFGPGPDEPMVGYDNAGTRYYFHADGHGNVVAHSNAAGTATRTIGYDDYGRPSTFASRFLHAGKIHIGTLNAYYNNARFYDYTLGRFLQTDPVGYDDQINLYAYVGNDPINGADPAGMTGECPTGSLLPGNFGGCRVVEGYATVNGGGRGNRNLLMPLPHGDCDTRAQCDFARDEAALRRGDMSESTFIDRMRWRGIGAIIGAAPHAGSVVAEAIAAARLTTIAAGVARWLGPGFTARTLPNGNRVFESGDRLRRFRIDFTQARGTFHGPHAQFESRAFLNRPYEPAPGIPRHIYFGPQ